MMPTILVVHDRGTKGGHEERFKARHQNPDTGRRPCFRNRTCWQVVNTQTLAQVFKQHRRRVKSGFDEVCGLGQMTTQSEITQTPNDRLLHHNAQDDAWVTSHSMIYMVKTRATELMSVMNGPKVYILGHD